MLEYSLRHRYITYDDKMIRVYTPKLIATGAQRRTMHVTRVWRVIEAVVT